jgi:hypothetical protein
MWEILQGTENYLRYTFAHKQKNVTFLDRNKKRPKKQKIS